MTIPGSDRYESRAKLREDLEIDPSLPIFTVPDDHSNDPVTYAVVSNKLAQINDEAGATTRKVSGSIIVTEAYDFNTALTDARGDVFGLGPYMSIHGTAVQRLIQWTLENRSANPGIRDGDAFLVNDPWVGSAHQNDTALLRPIFVEGQLFAWTVTTLHFVDLGGRYPSSFVPDAEDVFSESLPIPPMKYLEGGVVRSDVEDMFLRRSRMPLSGALDLRALVASTAVADQRIRELAATYGSVTVAAVIQEILDSTEKKLRERLAALPDGTWRHLHLWESSGAGDRGLYRLPMTMTKIGDRLSFDLTGTDPQKGFFNCTRTLSEASIVASVLPLLCFDLPWATGAILRVLDFSFTPGSIIAAQFPAAVGGGGSQSGWTCINSSTVLISKMLAAGPAEMKEQLFGVSNGGWVAQCLGGLDRNGNGTLALSLDQAAGGTGARSWADGDDAAGMTLSPGCQIANVEAQEWYQPLLWLYRKELPDSGGPGRFRGGTGAASAVVPHGTPAPMFAMCFSSGLATPNGAGLNGGWPAKSSYYQLVRDSDIHDRLTAGRVPADLDDLSGSHEWPHPKSVMLPVGLDDVYGIGWSGGGGYGDPLERDLAAVADDVDAGLVTLDHARDVYGVVFLQPSNPTSASSVDEDATARLRASIRRDRLGHEPMSAGDRVLPDGHRWLDENITVSPEGAAACGRCQTHLADPGESYKTGMRIFERPLGDTDRVWQDPATYCDDVDLVFRQFLCPGCGTLLEVEVTFADEPPLEDKRLVSAGAK
ncbi:hydantoinase B/oxoprolinase family protein [Rhodococcus sp. NPDC127530]|uniref:hydantoinase B/oxoprolinase family protein n=1 Tax=unclassified Rhodococcus (in: high G+C Gram-positive bacteria) TaxID=192944 RepID=UPI003632BE70